jgi:hypothetical protein
MGTRFYSYHDTISVLKPLNWSGHRLKGLTTAALVNMGLELKL